MEPLDQLPTIHYLWVGAPPSDLKFDDVVDIRNMKLATPNPIDFYCLEKHVDHYNGKLEKSGVAVKSIEGLLKKCIDEKSDLAPDAKKILDIFTTTLANPARNKIADRVFFKDLFALFVLAYRGGITMDKNVRPQPREDESKLIRIPQPSHFCYPTSGMNVECWMMYSPENDKEVAKKLLSEYLSNWDKAQSPIKNWAGEQEYPVKFHINMQNLIIDTLMKYDLQEIAEKNPMQFDLSTADFRGRFIEFPIEKIYGNSHKHPEFAGLNLELSLKDAAKDAVKPSKDETRNQINAFKAQLIDAINVNLKLCYKRGEPSKMMASKLKNLEKYLKSPESTYLDIYTALSAIKDTPLATKKLFDYFQSSKIDSHVIAAAKQISENFKNRTVAAHAVNDYYHLEQKIDVKPRK
jgi:hypothetical protein